MGEFSDHLPYADLIPDLTPEQVDLYVAAGREGRRLVRLGERQAAVDAFGKQISIFPANHAPYLDLTFLAAGSGDESGALDYLHQAVVRGFSDLRSVLRAEAWTGIGRPVRFQILEDVVIAAAEVERSWPPWDSFLVMLTPEGPATVMAGQAALHARIAEMSPALGPRLTRMWDRLIDRGAAAMLEAYVDANPDAEDLQLALEQILTCYTGGPLREWKRLPSAPAKRLGAVARRMLDRFQETALRPEVLVARALASNARRDRKGALLPEALEEIRAALGEVLSDHPDSPMAPVAVVGLVRCEAKAGQMDRAAARYGWARERYGDQPDVADRIQRQLGELALRVGGLPDFRATTLTGSTVGPSTLRGKFVVLDFWATWCHECIEGFPALRRIDQRHGEEIALVGVNMDHADDLTPEALRAWIARERLPGEHVHDGLAWESRIVKKFGVTEIPFSVLVGPDGEVLAVDAHGKRLEKAVRVALK